MTIFNPILRGMHPDPSWIWDETRNQAVLVNSTFEMTPGLPLHVSNDLEHWTLVGHAVDDDMARRLLLPYVEDSGGLYAPTLRVIHGRYAIACTVSRLDVDKARAAGVDEASLERFRRAEGNFVIEADHLEGPWRGPYWISGARGADPDLFEDIDGSVFWTQTALAPFPKWPGQTEITMHHIDPERWSFTCSQLEDDHIDGTIIWNGEMIGGVWAEGPHLIRRGDYVYLMTAEGGTSRDHCEMAMRVYAPNGLWNAVDDFVRHGGGDMRSDSELDVTGPARRLFTPDCKNPILTHRHLGNRYPVQCVGHADFIEHPTLGWWLVCLGTRQTAMADGRSLNFVGRETFIAPVEWQSDAETMFAPPLLPDVPHDGDPDRDKLCASWPVVAPGLGRLPFVIQAEGESVATDVMAVANAEATATTGDPMLFTPWTSDEPSLRVRLDPDWRYWRLSDDDVVVPLEEGRSIRFRLDDSHYAEFTSTSPQVESTRSREGNDGVADTGRISSRAVEWTVANGNDIDRGTLVVDDPVTVRFGSGLLSLAVSDRQWNCLEWDGSFLSTESGDSFTGILVGIPG
ncbi:glycoside hydrolase family 43 protein [Bifidobacterium choloepi]|uniref:Glycoside hydrolase family 43 protein n=1 Tax=Bifidobacterium choloepi TaxID=2614131 RepID=A0A6I5MZ92_9BIFI|nr:glycoside hydrolase family 43 protein [Bifidobacterium choloepi]NEG69536.1 glycoside hydrolase family 43 protein [Bifidobacterium choloepi]